jgi:hypothetical protein
LNIEARAEPVMPIQAPWAVGVGFDAMYPVCVWTAGEMPVSLL